MRSRGRPSTGSRGVRCSDAAEAVHCVQSPRRSRSNELSVLRRCARRRATDPGAARATLACSGVCGGHRADRDRGVLDQQDRAEARRATDDRYDARCVERFARRGRAARCCRRRDRAVSRCGHCPAAETAASTGRSVRSGSGPARPASSMHHDAEGTDLRSIRCATRASPHRLSCRPACPVRRALRGGDSARQHRDARRPRAAWRGARDKCRRRCRTRRPCPTP